MKTVTMSSEQFRLSWGESIDKVMGGHQVIVERYNRPTMVVMSYEQHEALQHRLAELERAQAEQEFARQFAEIDAGNYTAVALEEIEQIDAEIGHVGSS